jgi:hypothetical protein
MQSALVNSSASYIFGISFLMSPFSLGCMLNTICKGSADGTLEYPLQPDWLGSYIDLKPDWLCPYIDLKPDEYGFKGC